MILVSSSGVVTTLAAVIPIGGIVAWLLVRARRRRTVDPLLDDPDYELVFPEGPDDKAPRRTTAGRRIARPR
jgi:hypothetical protein